MNNVQDKEEISIESGSEQPGPLEKAEPVAASDADKPNTLRLRQAIWIMWWAGTALIVLSWLGVVTNTIGWIGFAAALASSFISVMVNKFWRIPK